VLKGARSEVKAFAEQVIAERGVRHGHVVMMPIALSDGRGHTHSHAHAHAHSHAHSDAKKGGKT
jgi:CopG family transcriptional regulator, nickel-responsive regulator